jgi:hypothetical protein
LIKSDIKSPPGTKKIEKDFKYNLYPNVLFKIEEKEEFNYISEKKHPKIS